MITQNPPCEPATFTRYQFAIWVYVPNPGSKYPDYTAEEVGGLVRDALRKGLEFDVVIEPVTTAERDV